MTIETILEKYSKIGSEKKDFIQDALKIIAIWGTINLMSYPITQNLLDCSDKKEESARIVLNQMVERPLEKYFFYGAYIALENYLNSNYVNNQLAKK